MDSQLAWPPDGHAFVYATTMELNGHPRISFDLSVPGTTETTNLNNVIVGRVGGPDDDDLVFRTRLHSVVGAAVVAGGRIEAAMKRLIIVLTEKPNSFAAVDKTWTDLVQQLRREANRTDDEKWSGLRVRVSELLDRAEANRLKEHRDNIVHGFFWDFALPSVLLSRFTRRSDGHTIILDLAELERMSVAMVNHANDLEALLHGLWGEAMLPRRY